MRVLNLREQALKIALEGEDATDVNELLNGQSEYVIHPQGKADVPLRFYHEDGQICYDSHYFIGADWLQMGKLAVYVSSKLDDSKEIDYLQMLELAISQIEDVKHLEGLVHISLDKPSIELQKQNNLLQLLLVTEFVCLLQHIVKRGLRKSYHIVEETLESKIKGRISVGQTVHQYQTKGKWTHQVCRYQVYDIDTPENQLLKQALRLCARLISTYQGVRELKSLQEKISYARPFFARISDKHPCQRVQSRRANPLYKEHQRALNLAQLLLRLQGYSTSKQGQAVITTPPFWVDMSKLFELYVFAKLREVFPGDKEVRYHERVHYQEPDYLLDAEPWGEPYVIDAKYKPKYQNQGIEMDDARQISGYARLQGIYDKFKRSIDSAPPIKCLIVYPDQHTNADFMFTRDAEPQFETFDAYVRTYKVGIRLPTIELSPA